MGRSQRFPFQGGSAPFCGAGFVKQNLGWELAPPASTLASPLSAPLPPSTYQLRRKSFAQLLRENHLQAKSLPFSTPGGSVVNPQPFLSQPVKPSAQKGLGPLTAQRSPFLRRWGTDPSKTQNRPCWPRVARFWRYNRISSPIRPRHWKLSSRLGLFYFQRKEGCLALGPRPHKKSKRSDVPAIKFIDLFSGAGGFREGLERAGGFACVGHCEIDKRANQSYNALFSTEGEWFCEDIRTADPAGLPDFDLLCGGFPCQSFSLAGKRGGFTDPRGTLFFEIARLVAARHPAYLLLENVPGLISHDQGRTFAAILHALDRLGYGIRKKLVAMANRCEGACNRAGEPSVTFCGEEWQPVRRRRIFARKSTSHKGWPRRNSKDFGVPQSRRRVYLIGYLDRRCAGKVFPYTQTAGTALVQLRGGQQGKRVYSPEGVSCTLTAQAGGAGGKTGLYPVGLPIKEATKAGYKMAYPGDSVSLSYATQNTHRGRVGYGIAHTVTTQGTQGVLCFMDMNLGPEVTDYARCVTAKQRRTLHRHKRESSGVWDGCRIRRLTPRECFRLQGWTDDRIDKIIHLHSDSQLYKQAGNGVTVNVVEAIGKRIAAMHREVTGYH